MEGSRRPGILGLSKATIPRIASALSSHVLSSSLLMSYTPSLHSQLPVLPPWTTAATSSFFLDHSIFSVLVSLAFVLCCSHESRHSVQSTHKGTTSVRTKVERGYALGPGICLVDYRAKAAPLLGV